MKKIYYLKKGGNNNVCQTNCQTKCKEDYYSKNVVKRCLWEACKANKKIHECSQKCVHNMCNINISTPFNCEDLCKNYKCPSC